METQYPGLDVMENEPTTFGYQHSKSDLVRHLLLADGTERYGCAQCNYTSKSKFSIRPHLKVHKARPPKPEKTGVVAAPKTSINRVARPVATDVTPDLSALAGQDLASLNLGQLVQRARMTEQMRAQRDEARNEAAAARRALADWQNRAAENRERFEGWKERAVKAEKKLKSTLSMLQA